MKSKNEALTYNVQEAAKRICDLRKAHGYTQKEAAALVGIDRRSMSHIENGSKGCSIDLFIRLSEIYGVSLDYLIIGRDREGKLVREILDTAIEQLVDLRNSL